MKRLYAFLIAAALCFPSIGATAWWRSIQQVAVVTGGGPMTAVIGADFGGNSPSNSGQQAAAINGGSLGGVGVNRDVPIAIPGAFSNLRVQFPTVLSPGTSYTVTVTVNGVDSALTCTVTDTVNPCFDTTHSAAFTAGQTAGLHFTPSGTPTASSPRIATTFTGTSANESPLMSPASGNPTTGSAYVNFANNGSTITVEANAAVVVPTGGFIDQFYYLSNAAAGAGNGLILTLMKNGSTTSLTCSVSGAGSGLGITTCNDTNVAHAVTYSAGDTISIQLSVASGTPAANLAKFGLRWTPVIQGEYPLMGASGPTTVSTFSYLYGNGAGTSETNFSIAPVAFTIKKFSALLLTAPGGAAARTSTLRFNSTNGAITCAMTGAATTCSDTVNTYSASINDLLDWRSTPSGGPAASASLKQSSVVTVP